MENICSHKVCTGCCACQNACPRGAIKMVESEPIGAIYPVINQELCVDCNLCARICPSLHPVGLKEPIKCYAITTKDIDDLKTSTSGGASSVIVNSILDSGGVAYGCVQDDYKNIGHQRVTERSNAYKLKQSKYVHSDNAAIFRSVHDDLKKGNKVLYIGTPCQVAGLRNFLKIDYENLTLIDLVCHGVPPQRLLKDYVRYLLRKNKIEDGPYKVSFRRTNPSTHKIEYGLFIKNDGKDLNISDDDCLYLNCGFTTAFYACISLRDNCYSCAYAKRERCGDITLGDFWGIKNTEIDTKNGISVALVNTSKGDKIVQSVLAMCNYEIHPIEEAIKGNGRFNKPADPIGKRKSFVNLYSIDMLQSYKVSCEKYINICNGNMPISDRFYRKLRNLIKRII